MVTIHHGIYHGWCLPKIQNDLLLAYDSLPNKATSFRPFVEYIESKDPLEAEIFWTEYLENVVNVQPLCSRSVVNVDQNLLPVTMTCSVSWTDLSYAARTHQMTVALLAKAAWALTMAMYTQKDDVVFGNVVSGRDVPVTDVEQ